MRGDMKYKICVITGTRAEYGLLRNVLFKLRDNSDVNLTIVVTGSHLSSSFGNSQDEILSDGFYDYAKIPIPIDDDSREGMAASTGVAMTRFSEFFTEYRPDIIVVLGDRYEIFAAVSAAHIIGIPVAHISGGDVTEGAVDDAFRHCITKMSVLHFPGCEQSAKRIIQMGEEPNRVFNVGEPGVENCLKLKLLPRQGLANSISFSGIMDDYSIVTFHPVTMEENTVQSQVYELIGAMDSMEHMSYIITMANADAGGRAVNDIWMSERKQHPNWMVVKSLGALKYLSALSYARLVIGNSSSGVIEAPAIGVPTVNIGDRQKGRMMAKSVVCCKPCKEDIIVAMNKALSDDFQENLKHIESPFGNGTTSERIVDILLNFLKNKCETNEKHFHDIDFLYLNNEKKEDFK